MIRVRFRKLEPSQLARRWVEDTLSNTLLESATPFRGKVTATLDLTHASDPSAPDRFAVSVTLHAEHGEVRTLEGIGPDLPSALIGASRAVASYLGDLHRSDRSTVRSKRA